MLNKKTGVLCKNILKITMDSIADAIIIVDKKSKIFYMNPTAERLTGWNLNEAKNKDISRIFRIYNAKTRKKVTDPVKKVIKSKTIKGLANDTILISKTGMEYQIADSASPIIINKKIILGVVIVFRDITQQYRLNDEIKRQREYFKKIFDNSPVGIHTYKVENDRLIFTGANRFADIILKIPHSEFIGREITEIFPNLKDTVVPEKYKEIALKGIPWDSQEFFYKDSKINGYFLVHAFQTSFGEMATMFMDISEKKRYEEALKKNEEKYKKFLFNIPAGFVVHQDGKIVFANNEAARLMGRVSEEVMIGEDVFGLLPPELRDGARKRVDELYKGLRHDYVIEEPFLRSDGTTFDVEVRSLLTEYEGRPAGTLIFFDISTINKLRRERDAFFNYSINLMCILDFDGSFKDVNPSFTETLGWEYEELMNKKFIEIVSPHDQEKVKEIFEKLVKGELVKNMEIRCTGKDNVERWIMFNSFPVLNEKLIYSVGHNMTEYRKLEEHLRHAEKMEAIGHLVGGISHDFNNLLTAILGYAELIKDSLAFDCAGVKDYIEGIISAAINASQMTGRLLAFVRKGKFQSTPVDLFKLVKDTVELLERTIDKKYKIIVDIKEDKYLVLGDPSQIQNAILNLCINSRDAMPDGGNIIITIQSIKVDEKFIKKYNLSPDKYDYFKLSVMDNGPGIPEDIRDKVFDAFFTTKEEGRGTGIGLAAVAGAMNLHNGAVDFECPPSGGTIFHLFFPVLEKLDNVFSLKTDQSFKPLSFEGLKVLVIDDEEDICNYIKGYLEKAGCTVYCFYSGMSAIEFFKTCDSIDVVILDIIMPDMSGHETFKELRKINNSISVIISSGYSLNEEVQKIIEEGAVCFLQKPYTKDELMNALAVAIKSKI